jgi:uncharacterized delta-60 repeat protein
MFTPKIHKLILTLLLAIGLVAQPASAGQAFQSFAAPQANGSAIWQAFYDGPDKQADSGKAVAIDSAGNTYVAGTSDGYNSNDKNIVVIKYNPSGQALWTKIYNGPGRSDGYNVDEAVQIGVDDLGYVYVVGNSASEMHMDIVSLRYKPDGSLDWEKRYSGPATEPLNQSADAEGMIVTGDAVYVAGGGNDDSGAILVVLKYAKTGELQWERHYAAGGPSHLAIDKDGLIYQVGNVYSQVLGVSHFVVIKYQPDGTLSWGKIYRENDIYPNDANGIQVDSEGNILIGGTVERAANFGTAIDAALIKFDPAGNIVWERQIADPNQQNNLGVFGFCIDNAGSSYLSTVGMYVFKYDSSGNQAWMIHSDELTVPGENKTVMKSGPDQSLYIIAAHGIMKYGPAGNALLSYQYEVSPSEALIPIDFALGADASIAITGWYNKFDPYSIDMLTVKYPMNPGLFLTVEDALTSEGNRSDDSRTADFVVRLSKSLTYSVSFKYQTVDLSAKAGSDYVKTEGLGWIDPGQPWEVISVPILPNTNSGANKQFQLKIVSAEGVTIVNDSAYATILDDDFDLVAWSKSISTPGSDSLDIFDLKTDSLGNGYIKFGVGISSFDPNGILRWTKTFPGITTWMQLDAQDNLYLTGADTSNRLAIRKLDNSGNILWEKFYGDSKGGSHTGSNIAIDGQGNVFVSGIVSYQSGSNPTHDTILLKYTQSGDLLWTRQIHTQGVEVTAPHSIFADSAGDITLVGGAYNPGSSVVIAKYSPDGNLLWNRSYSYSNYTSTSISQAQYDIKSNLFLGVMSSLGNDQRIVILKINASGEIQWEYPCGFVGCGLGQDMKSLQFDPSGNLIETITAGSLAWVVKFRERDYLWMWQLPMYSVPGEAASDADGFSYVTGGQQIQGFGYVHLYMIFAPSGTPLYELTESGQGTPISGLPPYLAVNQDRSVYAMGGSTGSASVVKYAPLPLPVEARVLDGVVKESDNAQKEMTFRVQLSKALDHDINLEFHTVDGTATAGQDYISKQGKLTIPAHSLSASIQVPILSDSLPESSEFFYLTLSGLPDGVIYARSVATGKILDSSAIQLNLPLIMDN